MKMCFQELVDFEKKENDPASSPIYAMTLSFGCHAMLTQGARHLNSWTDFMLSTYIHFKECQIPTLNQKHILQLEDLSHVQLF